MENLSISDQQNAQDAPGASAMSDTLGRPPSLQQPQQLPAQMFTTAAQLLDLTDKKLMVALRDGRKLIGILRSWDQFANLVLQSTVERIFAPPGSAPSMGSSGAAQDRGLYADIPRGIFLVRGENVLLLGEIDLDKDDDPPPGYDKADPDLVQSLAKQRKIEDKAKEKARVKKLAPYGFEGENMGKFYYDVLNLRTPRGDTAASGPRRILVGRQNIVKCLSTDGTMQRAYLSNHSCVVVDSPLLDTALA